MEKQQVKKVYFAFLWHGFFLAITLSMLDMNTVFPTLINRLSQNKVIFALMLTITLGTPLIFNMLFSHYLRNKRDKKKYLLIGILMRSFSFLGMAVFTYLFGLTNPTLTILGFFFFLLTFSISAGFAGISYSDLVAKTIPESKARTLMYTYKQLISSVSGFVGGLIVTYIFSREIAFPANFSINLLIGFIGLFIATAGFWFLKEPQSVPQETKTEPFSMFIKRIPSILKSDKEFRRYILIENLSSFGMMIMPFYILFAKEILGVSDISIGVYLLFQISGAVFSNLIWGWVGKKQNAKSIVTFCILLGGFNPILAILLSNFAPGLFGIVFFLIGFTISGRKIGFEPYLLDITPSSSRIEYLGIRGSLNVLVVILPLIGALIIEGMGYIPAFILVSVVMIFTSILLMKSKKNELLDKLCNPS
ncbi:MAG: MFS transporter [Firmicutes bacterium]|nr:MFS transporter [Bacillota bacterium]